jgi:hypothetical protein
VLLDSATKPSHAAASGKAPRVARSMHVSSLLLQRGTNIALEALCASVYQGLDGGRVEGAPHHQPLEGKGPGGAGGGEDQGSEGGGHGQCGSAGWGKVEEVALLNWCGAEA